MDIGLSEEVDQDVLCKTRFITQISDMMNDYFAFKNYGETITTITIGIICIGLNGEGFFKIRKKYNKRKGLLEYDIKLDHSRALVSSQSELIDILRTSILDSLSIFEELKIKDFDAEGFKKDMADFFGTLSFT